MRNAKPNPSTQPAYFPPMPELESFDQIPLEPLQWLWHPYIPLGKITLLLGDNDTGKSLFALHLAAQLSTASPLPAVPSPSHPITPSPGPAETLILAPEEEGPKNTLRPRLEAAHADLPRIHRFRFFHSLIPQSPSQNIPNPIHPLYYIESALKEKPNIKLLIIDSLPVFLGESDRLNPSAKIDPSIPRTVLASLCALADQYQIAVLALTRITKSLSPRLLHRAAGSHAFSFRARSALLFTTDPEKPESNRRLLIPLKHNLTEPPPSRAFQIIRPENAPAPTIQWEEKPIPLAPYQIAQLSPPEFRRDKIVEAAAQWLTSALTKGPQTVTKLQLLADTNGIKLTTLQRAKERLGVLSTKEGTRDKWWWSLPTDTTPIPPPPRTFEERLEQQTHEMLTTLG